MTQLDIHEAGQKFAELVRRAQAGEEIVLSDGGKPVALLVPARPNPRRQGRGMYKGRVWMSDDFHAPLTDEELKEWGL